MSQSLRKNFQRDYPFSFPSMQNSSLSLWCSCYYYYKYYYYEYYYYEYYYYEYYYYEYYYYEYYYYEYNDKSLYECIIMYHETRIKITYHETHIMKHMS
jgi:hypothetical protein